MRNDITPSMETHPILETERLVLRPYNVDDFDDCLAMWSDPAVVGSIPLPPSTQEDAWARTLRYVGHWHSFGYGFWAAREKSSGRFVGDIGLADFKRIISVDIAGVPEAGWVMASWAHGKGFATEAVRAVHDWFETRFGPTRTICLINAGNAASLRVADRCGYKEWARADYHGKPTIVLERRVS